MLVCSLGAAACAEELEREMPVPPVNMPLLRQYYEQPTGIVDEQASAELFDVVDFAIDDTLGRATFDFFESDVVTPAIDAGGAGGTFGIDAAGFVELERECTGDGELNLILTFSEAGIDPVVWGTADDCRERIGDFDVALSGTVAVDWTARLLLVEGAVEVDGADAIEGDFDMRATESKLEFRQQLADGTHWVIAADPAGFSVRAANGTWQCVLAEGDCRQEDAR